MNFRIADTFTDSLSKLTGEEQKAVQDHRQDEHMSESQQFLIYQSEDDPSRIDVMLEAKML